MLSLRQQELYKWQQKNFGEMSSEELVLGMVEEIGELCHILLKRKQGIREGANKTEAELKAKVADAFGDVVIYGINMMQAEGLDAEKAIVETIKSVLKRDWVENPAEGD